MFSLILSLLVTLSSALTHWDYTNTEHWGDLEMDNNFCGSSFTTQSPINIDPNNINSCSSLSSDKLDWWLNAEITELIVTNTGHTIVIHLDDSNDHAKLKNNFKTDSGEHGDYKLDHLHLHWGANDKEGSEHTITGKQTVLEMHFVHYSTDYDSLDDALKASPKDPYVLAVVAVLYTVGAENEFIKSIIEGISEIKNNGGSLAIHNVNIGQIVPNVDGNNIRDNSKFYYYKGSLTTPPCSPIVQWHILEDTMTVSSTQLQALRENIYNSDNVLLVPNYRPVQTNTNSIYDCGLSQDGGGDDSQ